MSNPSPSRPTRVRRPTKRFEEYDGEGLERFSESVGRVVQPPATASHSAEQVQRQKETAATRGNASQPDPLPSRKRKADDNATSILDRQIDDITDEAERLEWLYEAIEHFGDPTNYRADPDFQDEGALWEVWEELQLSRLVDYNPAPSTDGPTIRSGMTKALVPQKSGHSSAAKLVRVDNTTSGLAGAPASANYPDRHGYGHQTPAKLTRTDHTTIGLDGTPANRLDHREHGYPVLTRTDHTTIGLDGTPANRPDLRKYGYVNPPKLARTDRSTVGLDGRPLSPPRTQVLRYPSTSKLPALSRHQQTTRPAAPAPITPQPNMAPAKVPASSHHQQKTLPAAPAPTTRPVTAPAKGPAPKATVPPGRAIVSRSQVDALRQQQGAARAHGSAATTPARGASAPSGSARIPSPRVAPQSRASDEDVEMEVAGGDEPEPLPSMAGDQDPPGSSSTGDNNETELLEWVMERVKVEMAVTCPFPEVLMLPEDDNKTYLESWVPELWAKANNELRADKPHIGLMDNHVGHVRTQLSQARNKVRGACDGLLASYFDLRRSRPDHAQHAVDITKDEKWVSPNIANDDLRFQHPIILDTICNAYFKSKKSLGMRHKARFTPVVPLSTIAFVCSIIRHLIKAFEVENVKAGNLSAAEDADGYLVFMNMLDEFGEQNPGCLLNARLKITLNYLKSCPQPPPVAKVNMKFGPDQEVDEDNLLEIKDLFGDAVPEVDNWEALRSLKQAQKGKARASNSSLRKC